MNRLKFVVARAPIVGPVLMIAFRSKPAFKFLFLQLSKVLRWLFTSRETTNFTYDLDDLNKRYLTSIISGALSLEYGQVEAYIEEVEQDAELKEHISRVTAASDHAFMADPVVRFGRRIGWYAFVRAMKPRVVVETGVDKGLGSCVLTAALRRNAAEGFEGRYYGTDINPEAGYLLSGELAGFGSILYGDSIASLLALNESIDLFINDSDHSDEYEAKEYVAIEHKLSPGAIVLGDNSHGTDKLLNFSLRTGRQFLFFQERPKDHWYPGAGIGISYFNKAAIPSQ